MKTTYLIYKQVDGRRQLVVASQKEWGEILELNKKLPEDRRRHFILDCIEEGEDIDRMYIEVSKSDHKNWNSKHTVAERNRRAGELYTAVSMDAPDKESMIEDYHDAIPSELDLERVAVDHILLEELKHALEKWKPWAKDLLDYYLKGKRRSCTSELCKKFGVKERAVEYRKAAFEKFVKDFLK